MSYKTRSSRVRMDSIQTLTFYNDELTAARRSSAVAQMVCEGKPCQLFQPDVIQCQNMGGSGNDIEWKCQADLPSSIRFGRVEVGCEGWDNPDDPYILKGSCGLTYHLVRANPNLENSESVPGRNRAGEFAGKFAGNFFNLLTSCILFYMFYALVLSPLYTYFTRNTPYNAAQGGTNAGPRPPRPWFGGFGPGSGGGGGNTPRRPPAPPPPPYSANEDEKPSATNLADAQSQSGSGGEAWRPGFWSGIAAGAGGAALANGVRNRWTAPPEMNRPRTNINFGTQPRTTTFGGGGGGFGGGWGGAAAAPRTRDWDRGEGPSGSSGGMGSGMGSMRTSSGFGGTRNR